MSVLDRRGFLHETGAGLAVMAGARVALADEAPRRVVIAIIGTGGMGIDFGLGVQKFFPDSRGGFKVGLELGGSLGMTSERWNSANIYAENLGYWNPQMLYFTLCIGGGAINQNASPNAK